MYLNWFKGGFILGIFGILRDIWGFLGTLEWPRQELEPRNNRPLISLQVPYDPLIKRMNHETRAELRLEPSGFGWHDVARIGDVHKLIHRNGIEGKGNTHLAAIDTTLEFAKATQTAYEVDALVATKVLDSEDTVENEVGRDADIEHADGIVVIVSARLGSQAIPTSIEVEAEVVETDGMIDLGAHLFDHKVLGHLGQELLAGEAVEVLHNAVVVHDLKLTGREAYSQEEVVLLVTRMLGVLESTLLSYSSCSCGAMMTVSHIEIWNGSKSLGDGLDGIGVVDYPELMDEALGGSESLDTGTSGSLTDNAIEHLVVGECEEHRLHVGREATHVLHAVLLLVGTSEFVLLDDAIKIVVDISSNYETILGAAIHGLAIKIIIRSRVLDEPTILLEFLELLDSNIIDLGVVLVGNRVEIYLGFDDVIERLLIALALIVGLLRRQDIVGT